MKRFLLMFLLTALVLTMVSCKGKDTEPETPDTTDTSAIDTEERDPELLTFEKIVEDLESTGAFDTQTYDSAMLFQAEKDFNGEIDVTRTSMLSESGKNDSWIAVYGLANEEDAKEVEEGRNYLVESRFGDDGYCRRFGSIVLYGNLKVIDELDYSGYTYPESCEPMEAADPGLDSVEGIVATIESKGTYGAIYYGGTIISSLTEGLNLEGDVLKFANTIEYTTNSEWI